MEQEEAQLLEMHKSLTVKEQLGRLIAKRNMKIGDIVIKWDSQNTGEVLKVRRRICRSITLCPNLPTSKRCALSVVQADFATNVLELGVMAEVPAIDEVFDSYDVVRWTAP